MNSLTQFKKISILPFLIALMLVALAQNTQAVSPPPDGGYPGFTTAEGTNALQSLTTGSANTAVGWSSLLSNAAGSFNTATGAGSLLFNTADANTAFGTARSYSTPPGQQHRRWSSRPFEQYHCRGKHGHWSVRP
jgi:hypothetical protein